MSTDSLFRKMFQSSAQSPNVSDAEELELLTKFQSLEERSRLKYKKKLEEAKKKIAELEKKISEYESLLKNQKKEEDYEEEDNYISSSENNKRRMPFSYFGQNINNNDLVKSQYITYLENFADVKCDEVECLLNRLLKLQNKRKEKIQNNVSFRNLQKRCNILEAENNKLRSNFSKAKLMIEQFTIAHRESKAERRTRELQELASLTAEYESKNLELFSFISTQFRQFFNIDNGKLDEATIRAIVSKAAEMLRKQSQSQ